MNINETRKCYESLNPLDMCQCDSCKNFYSQVSEMYPEVAAFLNGIGVDIEKPHESWSVEVH